MALETHERCQELLLLYVAGQLDAAEVSELEAHLLDCAACRADLALWQAVSGQLCAANRAVDAPAGLDEAALERVRGYRPLSRILRRAWQLTRAQASLVRRELWTVSSVVMALGVIVALLAQKTIVLYFLAPLMAAAGLAVSFGPENDPAFELTSSTPTSLWQIILARLALVSGYNLLLTLAASLALLTFVPPELLGTIILAWLGPMTLLSALALLLSLWIGTTSAIVMTYGLWIAQYDLGSGVLSRRFPSSWATFFAGCQSFWQQTDLLLLLSVALLGIALLSANRLVRVRSGYLA